MATPIEVLVLALEASCQDLKPGPSGADVGEGIQDHGVPRPAPTQAPPREALHPASAAVASDCSGETRAAEVLAPSGKISRRLNNNYLASKECNHNQMCGREQHVEIANAEEARQRTLEASAADKDLQGAAAEVTSE
ncbi:hypothetical protein EVAR_50534_1 [Eumeta japonica]|uniref:Uncharacterized protein n=1 Tax=Eumeta variegata TaxID=151549 RepID=A0A4C1YNB7_EUMVA|nr:hypothetical protein EVAR_50534_1 [Eumeta japonica]